MLGILEAHWYLKMYDAERLLSGESKIAGRRKLLKKAEEKGGKDL